MIVRKQFVIIDIEKLKRIELLKLEQDYELASLNDAMQRDDQAEKANVENVGKAIECAVKQREIDAIIPGAIVVHRKDGTIGRCVRSTFGISVCYAIKGGRGQTIGDYPHFVAQHWRPATDEEVRRYFDAD